MYQYYLGNIAFMGIIPNLNILAVKPSSSKNNSIKVLNVSDVYTSEDSLLNINFKLIKMKCLL